jgi:N-acyl-D-amino-acid deacylase
MTMLHPERSRIGDDQVAPGDPEEESAGRECPIRRGSRCPDARSRARWALGVLVLCSLGLFPTSPQGRAASGFSATGAPSFDVIVRGGLVYDGLGTPPRRVDVGLRGDTVEAIGDLGSVPARLVIDAAGLAVAPGFINMLSWSTESLLVDGRSLGELRQGVTTQIFGEGWSMGPLNEEMKRRMREAQGDLRYDITWTTLAEYLAQLERRGVSQNVASFVGATTIREHVIGLGDKVPTLRQLDEMKALVRKEMQAGALGIGSSLIYAPGFYASTEELVALCKVAAEYGGRYISHMRSEGERLLEAVDELIRISRAAGIPAEIHHLKAAGESNWPKMTDVIARVEAARREGLRITANMYTYTAGSTGLDAAIPPWALDGGSEALFRRLRDPDTRARILQEVRTPTGVWESLYRAAGSPDRVLLVGFRSEALKPLTGKSLAEVARLKQRDPDDTILDLVLEDQSLVGAVYFLMSEENLRRQIQVPWVSFGSDAQSMAAEEPFTRSSTHPRAYGNFARLLGKYVREERLIPLEEAIRRLTSLPADNIGWTDRGRLAVGARADLVVFDPGQIADRATYDRPHQYAVGVRHVFVNGVHVLAEGEHTGARPGRALRSPATR